MRVQISLPPESWDQIKQLAQVDRRSPRQQAEWLLIRLLKDGQSNEHPRELAPAGADRE